MFVDILEKSSWSHIVFDVIVVGAGAVGLSLAIKLARGGKSVALVEAGPIVPTETSQAAFQLASASGQPLPGLHSGRFRALGGTTNFWGGQLVPFETHIFEARPWIGATAWPIRRHDIEGYYVETFNLLGMNSALEDEEIWKQLKLHPAATDDVLPFFTRWAPKRNFAQLFGSELRDSVNLRVFLDSPVIGLNLGSDKQSVEGVEIGNAGGFRYSLRGTKVVLASGTVEATRLLLLNSTDGSVTPWGENKWLGRGFLEHIDCYAGTVQPIDKQRFSDFFDNVFLGGMKYSPKLRLSAQAQRREHLLDISAHFVHRSSFSENIDNLKIFFNGMLRGRLNSASLKDPIKTLGSLRFAWPMVLRYLRYRRMYNFSDGGILLRLTSEQSPRVDSQISLRRDVDQNGTQNVDVNWKIDQKDIETLAIFADKISAYLRDQNLADVLIDPLLAARDVKFMESVDDANHHMGGARMGIGAHHGVVDMNLKVFGSSNLFVVGAATYPSSGFANPTLTAIALALRLSDSILNARQ